VSVVVRYSPVNVTFAQYDTIDERIKSTLGWPPPGLDHHIAFGADGDLRVSEVWDSREQWEAWTPQVMPILIDEGVEMSGEPEVFDVHRATRV
jgi:hypothetical protein